MQQCPSSYHDLSWIDARGFGTLRDEAITQLDNYFAHRSYKEFVDVESSTIY